MDGIVKITVIIEFIIVMTFFIGLIVRIFYDLSYKKFEYDYETCFPKDCKITKKNSNPVRLGYLVVKLKNGEVLTCVYLCQLSKILNQKTYKSEYKYAMRFYRDFISNNQKEIDPETIDYYRPKLSSSWDEFYRSICT